MIASLPMQKRFSLCFGQGTNFDCHIAFHLISYLSIFQGLFCALALVPAGGVDQDGNWLPARNAFLLPVKALAKIFRAKFRQALRKADCYEETPTKVWRQPWIVHCKAVGDGASTLKYLAPYIFRVAISNNRIIKMSDTHVTFRYRSTKTGKTKICVISTEEFIRRFLQHVLPKGFVKVRYFGFFSPGLRTRLAHLRTQLEAVQPLECARDDQSQAPENRADLLLCPVCGQPMQKLKTIPAQVRQPP